MDQQYSIGITWSLWKILLKFICNSNQSVVPCMTPHIHVVCSSIIYPLLEGSIINLYSFSKRTKERNHSFFLKKRTKRNGSCPLGRFLQPKRKCKEKSRKQGVDDVFACNFAFGNSVALARKTCRLQLLVAQVYR